MRRVTLLPTFLALACLTGVHVYVNLWEREHVGFLLVLAHLFEIVLVLSMLALCAAVGNRLLTRCRCSFESALEMLLLAIGIGSGVAATAILLLGLFSGLQTITITGLLVFFAIVSKNEILALPTLVLQAATEIKTRGNALSLIVFGIVAIFMVSQALLPPTDWDSLVYHLRVPAQFLEEGKIFLPEDNLHVAFVQLVHMLYIPLLAYGSTSGPALLSAFFALLLGLALFAFASRFFEGRTAAFSLVLLWANTMVLLVAITPRVDVTLAFYLLLAHFALLRASSDWIFFYISAVLLGLAAGVKYHAIAYGVGLIPLIVWVAYAKEENLRRCFLFSSAYGLFTAVVTFPWLVKNWLLFGAPLYPFFAQRKVDPWLTFFYPNEIHPEIVNVYGEVRKSFNLVDLFLNPIALTVEAEAFFYNLSPLFLCLVLWFIYYLKDRRLNSLMIPSLCYFAVTLAFSSKTNLRYLLPVFGPFTIVSVYVITERFVSLLGLKKALIVVHVVSLVALWPSAKAMVRWSTQNMKLHYLAGFASRDDYLKNSPGFSSVVSYINQHVSSEGRVLMLFEARGFYFEVPVIQDNLLRNWLLLAGKASFPQQLKSAGISYVLFNKGAIDYFFRRGLDPITMQWDSFHKFKEDCLVPVFESSTHILFKVKD